MQNAVFLSARIVINKPYFSSLISATRITGAGVLLAPSSQKPLPTEL